MSVTGISTRGVPNSLTGLETINANYKSTFVPYTGANNTVDLNSQRIMTTFTASSLYDLTNKSFVDTYFLNKNIVTAQAVTGLVTYTGGVRGTLAPSIGADLTNKTYVDTNFLSKTSGTDQSVASMVDFVSGLSTSSVYLKSGLFFTKENASQHAFQFQRYADGSGYLTTLGITDGETGNRLMLFTDNSQIVYRGLTLDYMTASKVPVLNANKQLVSSGVDAIKISYLDNVTSDIQAQLNSKLNLSGGTMTGNLDMGANKVTSTYYAIANSDLTNKLYVDNVVSGLANVYVIRAGDTMTGPLIMGGNKVTSTYTPINADDLTRKGYVDTALALKADKSYVDAQDAGLQTQINLKANLAGPQTFTGTHTFSAGVNPITLSGLTANRLLGLGSSKDVQTINVTLLEAANLSGTTGPLQTQLDGKGGLSVNNSWSGTNTFSSNTPLNLSAFTGQRALIIDASKNVTFSAVTSTELGYVSGVTSAIQTQLNSISGTFANYLPLAGGTMSGTIALGGNKITSSYTPINADDLTRKGYVDAQDALQVNLTGNQTINGVLTMTGIILPAIFANRAVIANGSNALTHSVTTSTELGYVSGVTSAIQTQLDTKASVTYVNSQDALRVAKTGDTMSGALGINTGANTVDTDLYVYGKGKFYNGTAGAPGNGVNGSDGTRLVLWPGNSTNAPYALGIDGSTLWYGTPTGGLHKWYAGTTNTMLLNDAGNLSILGGLTAGASNFSGQLSSGISGAFANITPNILFANSACHIDNAAGQVYLFTASQGHMAIGRNTTRNATTANLVLGTSSTEESEIISVKTDNSAYMPMSFASSLYTFTNGNVAMKGKTTAPYTGINFTTSNASGISWGGNSDNYSYSRIFDDAQLRIVTDDLMYFYTGGSTSAPFTYGNLAMYIDNQTAPRIGIGTDAPAYRLDVNGTGRIRNELYVGTEGNSTSAIYMGGTPGDTPYDHCVIENRNYSRTEDTELLLFKGNDVIGASGPDRIRLRANEICLDTYDGATSNRTAESIRMTVKQDGYVGINIRDPLSQLDINRSPARTGTHGSGLGLYVTNGYNTIAEFRDPNGTQGIGIGYNRIYTTSATNQNLELYAKGSGELKYEARNHYWWANGSGLAFPTMEIQSDGMLEVANAVTIRNNTTTANSQQFSLRTLAPVFVATNAWGYGTGGNGVLQVGAIQSSDYSGRAQDSISCRAWNDGNYIISFHNTSGTIRGQIAGVNSSSVAYNTSSDRRLKDHVHRIEGALDIVNRLEPVHFRWKIDEEYDFGFIAQDVYKVLPHLRPNLVNYIKDCQCKRQDICQGVVCDYCQMQNDEPVDEDGKPRYYSLDYGKFTPYLVGAVQEQQRMIKEQQKLIENLQSQLNEMRELLKSRFG